MAETTIGMIKSDGTALPEIKSIFFEVSINGVDFSSGLISPIKENRVTIPPAKRMLVKVCLNEKAKTYQDFIPY